MTSWSYVGAHCSFQWLETFLFARNHTQLAEECDALQLARGHLATFATEAKFDAQNGSKCDMSEYLWDSLSHPQLAAHLLVHNFHFLQFFAKSFSRTKSSHVRVYHVMLSFSSAKSQCRKPCILFQDPQTLRCCQSQWAQWRLDFLLAKCTVSFLVNRGGRSCIPFIIWPSRKGSVNPSFLINHAAMQQ